MYRVNYGNGQVSEKYETLAAARAHLKAQTEYVGFMFVQRWDAGGMWFKAVGERSRK